VKRPLVILAALVALLAAADALLDTRASMRHEARRALGALFTPAEARELRKLPALRIELSGATHAYGRIEGQWRCLTYHQAPADGREIQAWLDALVSAEGIVHARTTDEAPRYGINVPETVRVHLQGPGAERDPGGDVRATLELGHARAGPAGDMVFVRKKGTREIWACAGDLRAPLDAPRAAGLPPLLAPSAVPAEWLEQSGGIVEVCVERPGGGFVLARSERELDPATMQPGMLPWTWLLAPGAPCERWPAEPYPWMELAPAVAEAYVALVERLPYVAVLAPDDAPAEAPPVRTTLTGRSGRSLELVLATGSAEGALLRVPAAGTLYRLAPGFAELLAPDPDALLGAPEDANAWSAALETSSPR
jgi:hypothetical protein